ncbi:MAG: hypothetical protein R2932_23030 [Caldilineaceae bacterium]
MRLGCMLRLLHRNAPALEEFQKGYELDRTDPDGIMHYAMAEHDFGDRTHAKELYQEAMALATKSYPPDSYKMEVAAIAGDNIRALQKNQPSLWDMDGSAPPPTASSPKVRQPKAKAQKRQKSKPAKAKKKKRKRNK